MTDKKSLFVIQHKFWAPIMTSAQIFASSKDEAAAVLTEGHKDMKDYEILQILSLDEIEERQAAMMQKAYDPPEDGDPEPPKRLNS